MKTIRDFLREAEEPSDLPQIYCDMDMVLVDFMGGANQALKDAGHEYEFAQKDQHNDKDKKWEILKGVPKFWAKLKPMSDGLQLWAYIKKYNPSILSTPSKRMPTSKPEKKEWLKNHGMRPKEIHLVHREDKQKFATTSDGKPNVLIDDYIKNIAEWESQGGIGIRHVTTAKTIQELKKLGYK